MIILVTGARGWKDRDKIESMINHYWCLAGDRGEELVVRHGDCPTGADRIARNVVEDMQRLRLGHIYQDAMPAEWQHWDCKHRKGQRRDGQWYCLEAGPIRNQAMIDKGDIFDVHAYPLPGRHPGHPGRSGTGDCVRRALAAALTVTNYGHPAVTIEDMLRG
jgi:hypothetical protein